MKLLRTVALIVPAALLLTVAAGCETTAGPPDDGGEDFWPLELGHRWTYHLDDGAGGESTFELEASAAERQWFLLSGTKHRLGWAEMNGMVLFADRWPPPTDDGADIRVYLQPPLEVGRRWPLYLDGSGPIVELVEADFTYQTPDGDWRHCYKVEINSLWMVFARGIGWIAEGYLDTEMAHLISYDFD